MTDRGAYFRFASGWKFVAYGEIEDVCFPDKSDPDGSLALRTPLGSIEDCSPLLWIGALPAFLVVQIYLLGRRMSAPEKMLRPIPDGLSVLQRETISRHSEWLTSVNLEFRTSFQFGAIQAAVFQQKDQPRFFSFQFHQRVTFSAESYLEDLTILDTSNTHL